VALRGWYRATRISVEPLTSLAFIVNVPELTTVAEQVNNRTQIYPMEIFLFIGLIYFILCGGLSWAARIPARQRRNS
jgi:ABC-type amino acid transport system permease subunit